jgi:PucR family transcriptional regulator, purine catabolism regulatory protein
MAITVESALELEVVRGGLPEVVAGARSVDRRIRWAHAAEVPNIAALLRGGELVLTKRRSSPREPVATCSPTCCRAG